MQILSKGIEFDFPLCKELKIDWKLPKNNFQFFSSSEKLKIELNIAQNQFSFFWNYCKYDKTDMDVFVHGW